MTSENFPSLISIKELNAEFKTFEIVRINSAKFTLGRSLDNSVVIPVGSISRKHCCIQLEDNGNWVLVDTSSFGIKVNNQSIQKRDKHVLSHNDVLQLNVDGSFIYKFAHLNDGREHEETLFSKRIKLDQGLSKVSTEDIYSLETRIRAAQDNSKRFKYMKEQLEASLGLKLVEVNNQFDKEISSLCGDDVANKKAALEEEKDLKLHKMRLEMEGKVKALKETIAMHSATEEKLTEENTRLKEKLEAERKDFEIQLSKENDLKKVLQEQMEAKLRHEQLEREKEKKNLEENTRIEIELLKSSKEKEVKHLEEQMKLDQQAQEELKKIHRELQKQVHSTTEEKNKSEKEFQEKLQHLQKAAEDDKLKIEELENIKSNNENTTNNTNESERTIFGELMETELQCTICAELMIVATTLNCSHSFCKFCIAQWRKKKNICPICRANIKSECRSIVLDSFIDRMIQNLSEEMQQRRQQALKDRQELETQMAGSEAAKRNRRRRRSSSGTLSSFTNSDNSDYLGSSPAERDGRPDWEFGYDSDGHSDGDDSYGYRTSFEFGSESEGSASDYDFTASPPEPQRSSSNTVPADDAPQQQVVEGTPGSYYGGYGSCYICGARGHWSPGCPFR